MSRWKLLVFPIRPELAVVPTQTSSGRIGIKESPARSRASLITQLVQNLAAMQENPVQILSHEDLLETRKATHSSILGLPLWLSSQESACQCRRHRRQFSSWVGKIPWGKKWQLTPIFFPGKSHGQRSLVGYSSWGHKESEMTEHAQTY